jgi:phosphatidylinositol alpha 1,6-mannosyltransferase
MRISLYSGTFLKDQDGASKTLYALTDSLLKQEIEVGIWSPALTPQRRKGLFLFHVPSVPFFLYPDYRMAFPFGKTREQLLKFNPDLIQITAPDIVGTYFIKFATKRNIPVITSCHTHWPSYLKYYHLSSLSTQAWKFLKWFYNKSDCVYAPTRVVARELEDKGIKKVRIWSRGINRRIYNPRYRSKSLRKKWKAEERKVILYSGRFVWYKDLDVFLKVYQLFKEKGPKNVSFVLVGDGPIREELESSMPDAHFPGYLHGKDLSRVYASADIFLFPSTTETLGNVVQEALSSGLPAVVSDIGGCKEVVQRSKGGLIAKAKDPYAFYEKCKRLIEDEEFYNEKKINGLKFAEAQRWNKINGKLIEEYRNLVNERMIMRKSIPDPRKLTFLYKR